MKVLVTGAGGFIASHLCELLVERGYDVRAMIHYNSRNSWGWLENSPIKDQLDVVMGDIRDSDSVLRIMRDVEVVYHLAALIAIPFSYVDQQMYVEVNINGSLNVFQAARTCAVRRVMHTSTSEVYGTAHYVPIDEAHPRQGQSPYSASKIGADALAQSFFNSFELPITIMRPFNTYGPRQSARAIIPAIIVQLLAGKTEIELGSLHPTRDFVFVKDCARAMCAMADSDNTVGEEINIATGEEISIGNLAQTIARLLEVDSTITCDHARVRPAGSEVERLSGSNAKVTSLTGWQPQYVLEDGLRETIAWFQKTHNFNLYKPHVYNV